MSNIKCCRCGKKVPLMIETEKEFICGRCFWKNYVDINYITPKETESN